MDLATALKETGVAVHSSNAPVKIRCQKVGEKGRYKFWTSLLNDGKWAPRENNDRVIQFILGKYPDAWEPHQRERL